MNRLEKVLKRLTKADPNWAKSLIKAIDKKK
jgi:hypothetical protein